MRNLQSYGYLILFIKIYLVKFMLLLLLLFISIYSLYNIYPNCEGGGGGGGLHRVNLEIIYMDFFN